MFGTERTYFWQTKLPSVRVNMKITKRQLKKIIREEYTRLKRRGLLRENVEHFRKIAKLLVDKEKETVVQAIELGISAGYFKVEQYLESKAGKFQGEDLGGTVMQWKLQAEPELFDAIQEELKGSYKIEHKKSLRFHDDPEIGIYIDPRIEFYGYRVVINVVDRDIPYTHKNFHTLVDRY